MSTSVASRKRIPIKTLRCTADAALARARFRGGEKRKQRRGNRKAPDVAEKPHRLRALGMRQSVGSGGNCTG
jgi:hypothetical protein